MFIKTPENLRETGKEYFLCDDALRTIRYLTKSDGLGFSVSDVFCSAGFDEVLWYKHHWEAVYIVADRRSPVAGRWKRFRQVNNGNWNREWCIPLARKTDTVLRRTPTFT